MKWPKGYSFRPLRLFAVFVLIVVLVLVAALIAILILVTILVLILIIILILVLIVVHDYFLQSFNLRHSATVVCPKFYALSRALNMKLIRSPAVIAAVMPPAAAFKPPVSTPISPSCCTASFTPFDKV